MKKAIYRAAAVIAAAMLTGCSAIDSVMNNSSYEPPVQYEPFEYTPIESQFDYDEVSSWYPQLCADLQSGDMRPVIHERVTGSDLNLALNQFRVDIPDAFWIDGYVMHTKGGQVTLELYTMDDMDQETAVSMHQELEDAAMELISHIPEGSSDYEKVLFAHDYIASHCVYDYSYADSKSGGLWSTAYGCLVQGRAICSGYAEGLQYVLNLLGIESGIVSGYAYEGTGHAWNYVVLDGTTAWVDTTWDDEPDGVSHAYFMFDDDQMMRTRWLDKLANFVPECSSLDESWLVRNGGYFTEYDFEALSDYVGSVSGNCEIMFSDYDTYREALDSLIGSRNIWKLPGMDGSSVSYQRDDRMFYLRIIRE